MPFTLNLYLIIMILSGLLAVANYLAQKKENIDEIAKKMAPAQGALGIGLMVFSVIAFIQTIELIGAAFLVWLAVMLPIGAGLVLGLIMATGLISGFMGDSGKEKMTAMNKKLVFWQIPLGWISVGYGIFLLLLLNGGASMMMGVMRRGMMR